MVALTSRILTIGLAVYSYWLIHSNFPENLPGAPAATAARVMFAIQLLTSLLFFLVPFFPESVHFGSRRLADYAPSQLERITPLLHDMMGVMGLLMALYFAVNIRFLAMQALSSAPREAVRAFIATVPWLTGGLLVSEAVTTFYYLRRFDAATDSNTNSDSIDD